MTGALWVFRPSRPEAGVISGEVGIPLAIAQVLVNRKIETPQSAQEFLYGDLDDLGDPFLMSGMREAVARIKKAITLGQNILIFGDYDVDGILSVVMLHKALETLGGRVDYFVPERLKDGYGIKTEYVDIAGGKKADLVISVDCGIKAVEFVREAGARGIDVIVTDHHRPGPELPAAAAILDPILEPSGYPGRGLAGVGVVYKLVQALFRGERHSSVLPHYLKLVAIGTIADVVELRGENRILARLGLKGLEQAANPGLRMLLDACGLSGRRISEGDVGFRIGPRINAAGRMGATDLAIRLFFSRSSEECRAIVSRLETLNSKRQSIEDKIFKQASQVIKTRSLDERYRFLVMGCSDWHRGVIGIVASRLKEAFHRPILLFAYEDGKAYGSGRSISEFSMIECLDRCRDLFIAYGGHTYAVGCSLERERMGPFRSRINEFASASISDSDLQRKIPIDARLDLEEIRPSLVEQFSLLWPFGMGNPKPVFASERVIVAGPPQTIQGKHAKFLVQQKGRTFEALAWERADWAATVKRGALIDIAYSLHLSEYLGEERIVLSLEDIKI